MAQTLISHDIEQLEDFFAASLADPQALTELQEELRYRREPSAFRLLLQVQRALRAAGAAGVTATRAGAAKTGRTAAPSTDVRAGAQRSLAARPAGG